MSDENNILSPAPGGNGKDRLPEDKLMAYLEGKLPPHEQHEVELWLSEEGMESDAMEGLRKLDPQEARHSVNKLGHQLRKAVLNKKRARRKPNNDQFTWIAIAIILLLIVVAYLVIRRSM
jgi:anti-sigma factor RsiW